MKKFLLIFSLGFISCLYWVYSNKERRERAVDAVKKAKTHPKVQDLLTKVKEKNAALRNRSEAAPDETPSADTLAG